MTDFPSEPLPLELPGDASAGDATPPPGDAPQAAASVLTLTKDAFFVMFCSAFKVANFAMTMRNAKPLRTFDQVARLGTARSASDALYETFDALGILAWINSLSPEWIARLAIMGAFGIELANAVKAELHERHVANLKPVNDAPAAA